MKKYVKIALLVIVALIYSSEHLYFSIKNHNPKPACILY